MKVNIKNKLYKLFLLDVSFFILLSVLLLYARDKIVTYITMLMGYAQQVSQLAQQASSMETLPLDQVQYLTSAISPLTLKIKLIIYLFFPVALYLLWSVLQGMYYNYLNGKKFYRVEKHFLVNLPLFGLLLILTELIFRQFTVTDAINVNLWQILVITVLMLILVYYYNVLYPLMYKVKIKQLFGRTFALAFKKFYKIFPLSLLNIVLFILSFVFVWDILIKFVSTKNNYLLSLIFSIIAIFCWSFYKAFLASKVVFFNKK
ncbi:hypothetical protein D6777_03330 [Candidatus Woesearchaeota archaeon]|nr:MAG: hypothetical protein D6777_03330 [Candidatus Woesearchaeota archaeon]